MNPEKTNTLETIARLITISTVICYLIGVFTVNSYLYHLGISSLSSPLKPRFIYTGIVVLSSLGFSFFFPMIFIEKWRKTRPRWWENACFIKLVPAVVYFFINFLFVVLVNNLGVVILKPCLAFIIVICYWIGSWITGAAISLFLQVVFPVFSHRAGIYDWKVPRNEYTRFLACFLLIPALSLYITFFGHRVYPMIPEQFGGGQPRIIQLLLKSNETQAIRPALKIGDNLTTVTSQESTTALLFDEEQYYLIGLYIEDLNRGLSEGETKDGKILETIFQIDRDLVAGIKLTPDSSKYFLSYLLKLFNSIFYRD